MARVSKEKIKKYICDHKIEICIIGGTVIAIGLGYFGYKYIPKIKVGKVKVTVEASKQITETVIKEVPYKELWTDLSGEALTPTKLGGVVSMSAQKINKRLTEHGLQTRLPCGEYMMTDLGRKFGNDVWKVTASGHSFSNIEWDKRVLEVIFTSEELSAIDEMHKRFAEILAA